MPSLGIRWSEHEARKPYARPFGVSFLDDAGASLGGIAVSGADLLYYRHFKAAVLTLTGELFADRTVDSASDQQRAWLDAVALLLPPTGVLSVSPGSAFDAEQGRQFHFDIAGTGGRIAAVDAQTLLEYQELQAAIAHQSGRLFRDAGVEAIDNPTQRTLVWEGVLRDIVARPAAGEAMADAWPWR